MSSVWFLKFTQRSKGRTDSTKLNFNLYLWTMAERNTPAFSPSLLPLPPPYSSPSPNSRLSITYTHTIIKVLKIKVWAWGALPPTLAGKPNANTQQLPSLDSNKHSKHLVNSQHQKFWSPKILLSSWSPPCFSTLLCPAASEDSWDITLSHATLMRNAEGGHLAS